MLPATFPAPIVPAADSAPALLWGIVAPGGIVTTFAEALHAHIEQKDEVPAHR
ncbi:hypothetical protein [Salinibacterium sp. M195]|uniref:hypothetical protein n=1 Tax=Salinibacterium sp. M195 TaxID=2583374 RepID=UPI001C62A6C3|nr:hypothetical protein [Salinibacterium sp. M195]